jgi:lipid A 3-O-deacylase
VARLTTRAALGLFVATVAPSSAALAADIAPYGNVVAPQSTSPFLDWEVRGGVYVHDPLSPEAGSADLNAEILAPQLWQASDPFWNFLIPHPDLGTSVNLAGKTSNLWAGAAWNYDITQRIFISPTFGVGVNDGKAGENVPDHWNSVGCNWWFHESLSVGYRLTDAWSIMGTVEHSSNAGFCVQNRGLTNFGARLGYRF